MDKFSELKAAAMAATPGPWILDDDSWSEGDNANVSTEERYDGRIVSIAQIEGGGSESGFDEPFSTEQQANARYITAANPAAVLALLAELEAKDKRIEELTAVIHRKDGQIERAACLEDDVNFWKQRCLDLEGSSEISTITPTAWHFPGSDTESAQLGYDHDLDEGQKANCIPLYMRHEIPKMLSTAGLRIAELEAKLATPVRLPVVLMGYQSDDYRTGFMEGVEKSGEEVRAAGFKVEGDA